MASFCSTNGPPKPVTLVVAVIEVTDRATSRSCVMLAVPVLPGVLLAEVVLRLEFALNAADAVLLLRAAGVITNVMVGVAPFSNVPILQVSTPAKNVLPPPHAHGCPPVKVEVAGKFTVSTVLVESDGPAFAKVIG